ncbi:ABC transporter permease [Wukongibacter baidiensis]|uniref:ABC transporter permease n=1 Tax=Wukongibacter baidiensis TaxID=1723361 RepID=UPI003D7F9575
MDIFKTLKMAMKSIVSNKLRTLLTMLGIIIGVASVIIMVSIGEGASADIKSRIEGMGSNLLTVSLRSNANRYKLKYEELKNFEEIDGVSEVAPVISGNITAKFSTESLDVSLNGIDDAYMSVKNYSIEYGRAIVPLDIENREKVAVLGSYIVEELFGDINPVGEYIKIDGTKFKVVGVLESKGSSMGANSDEVIFIPISTAERFLKITRIRTIYIQSDSPESVATAQENVEALLLERLDNDDSLYRVFNQTEVLETIEEVTKSTSLMLGGIAAISLLVGGIGIMNIMLVSVTERTREIGIRKAIGAKRRNILTQFLIESSVISGIGGAIGIIISYLSLFILKKSLGMSVITPIYIVIAAFSFSLIVGIFFGLYPADKASKLRPVDALRYE